MVEKTYPTSDGISFVICDDVRQEANGKISLMGVFGGGDIIVPDLSTAQVRVVFFWSLQNGAGKFETKFDVVTPDGGIVLSVGSAEIEKQLASYVAVGFSGVLKDLQEGRYTARLKLDDHEYYREFWVRSVPK